MLLFMGVLFYCSNINNLIEYVYKASVSAEVLVDKFNEKLIKIDVDKLDDFIDGLYLQNYNEFILEDRIIIEGYSNKIIPNIISSNKKINIQISIFDGYCLVGSPLIKNSFWRL